METMQTNQLSLIRNSFHLNYLLTTIDFDSKHTRRLTQQKLIPIYKFKYNYIPSFLDNFKETMEVIYNHFPYNYREIKDTDIFKNIKSSKRDEYFDLYVPSTYDPACNDIQVRLLPQVFSSLNLSRDDTFVDLGSSTGRLVVAARLLSNCKKCMGIELSPSRTQAAIEAKVCLERMILDSNFNLILPENSLEYINKLEFLCGDICNASILNEGTVYFCGMGKIGRKELLPKLLKALCEKHKHSNIQRFRMICVGFTLPRLDGIQLIHGVTFPSEIDNFDQYLEDEVYDSSVLIDVSPSSSGDLGKFSKFYESCYGDSMGPRVLFSFDVDVNILSSNLEASD